MAPRGEPCCAAIAVRRLASDQFSLQVASAIVCKVRIAMPPCAASGSFRANLHLLLVLSPPYTESVLAHSSST